jgi:hypothetical protein
MELWGRGHRLKPMLPAAQRWPRAERAKLDASGEGVGYSFAGWEDELANEIIRADCIGYGDSGRFRFE